MTNPVSKRPLFPLRPFRLKEDERGFFFTDKPEEPVAPPLSEETEKGLREFLMTGLNRAK